MRRAYLASILSLSLLGCSGGGSDPDASGGNPDSAGGNPDSASNPDAPEPADARPPDATPANLDCLGDPLPTTADATVTISGDTFDPGIPGFVDPSQLGNIRVSSFTYGADDTTATPLDEDVTGSDGLFSLSASTGGTPLNAFIKARQDVTNPSQITNFVYPPVPVVTSMTNARIPMTTESNFDLLQNFTGLSQNDTDGLVTVIVADCNGDPIAGATVTSVPAAGQTAYFDSSGLPSTSATSTDATGVAFLLNVPIGNPETSIEAMIGATVGTDVLRTHTITVREFVSGNESRFTTTAVVP